MSELETIETLSDPELLVERAPACELAFVEAGRALDGQERAVNELRSRSSVLIAAAAITTSFFGGRAIIGDHLGVAVWIAIGAFAPVGLAVLAVLWPRHDWQFSADIDQAPVRPSRGQRIGGGHDRTSAPCGFLSDQDR